MTFGWDQYQRSMNDFISVINSDVKLLFPPVEEILEDRYTQDACGYFAPHAHKSIDYTLSRFEFCTAVRFAWCHRIFFLY